MYKKFIKDRLGRFSIKKKINFLWDICLHCGIKFKVTPSKLKFHRGLFCSKRCFQKSRHVFVKRKCKFCDKIFFVEPSIPKQGRGKYCSKVCFNKSMEHSHNKDCKCQWCYHPLEKHPSWLGGISFEPYPLGWNRTYKEQIRQRDKYKCQLCGVPEIECIKKLHVHHIDYIKKNISPSNLVSICNSCHNKTNFNREYWLIYFKEQKGRIMCQKS
jgi:hypothetical protein